VTATKDFAWYVGELAALAHLVIAVGFTVHILLYKRNIGTAISWMGIAWLSPFIGGALYYAFGVNRVKRRALRLRRERSHMFLVDEVAPDAPEAGR
jgi:cardiolipin synthase